MCDTSGTVGVGCIGPLGVGAGMSDLNTTIRSLTWTVKVVEHEYQAIQHVGATWTRTNDAAKPPSLCKLLMNKLDTWTRTFSGQLDEAQPEDSVNFELVVTLHQCFHTLLVTFRHFLVLFCLSTSQQAKQEAKFIIRTYLKKKKLFKTYFILFIIYLSDSIVIYWKW